MKLYELTNEYNSALTELVDSDFPPDVVADTLEGIKGELEIKAQNVAAFIANRQAEIAAVKDASKKLADRAKSEQTKLDGLNEYLKKNMENSGITEIRSPQLLLKIKKCPPSVAIVDKDAIPSEYLREIPARYEPDKTAIKNAIKEGSKVSGAELVSDKTRLEIK